MGQQVRVRVLDPSDAVRFDVTVDPTQAILAVLLAFLAIFAANLLLAPSQRRARVALRDKAKLLLLGLAHMLFSRDKSFKAAKQPDADLVLTSTTPLRRKRIIFVRHGESLWNSVFNKVRAGSPACGGWIRQRPQARRSAGRSAKRAHGLSSLAPRQPPASLRARR
jgi:hypothetical protein